MEQSGYKRIYESKLKTCVDLHDLHEQDEVVANTEASKRVADQEYDVELLPSIEIADTTARQQWLSDVAEGKNPDMRIDKKLIGDIKTPAGIGELSKGMISKAVYRAGKQRAQIILLNLYQCAYSYRTVKQGLLSALDADRNKSISMIWIISNKGYFIQLDRRNIRNESLYYILEDM